MSSQQSTTKTSENTIESKTFIPENHSNSSSEIVTEADENPLSSTIHSDYTNESDQLQISSQKKKLTYHRFNIIIDNTKEYERKLAEHVYLVELQSLPIDFQVPSSNFAIRKILSDHNIEHVARFKIINEIDHDIEDIDAEEELTSLKSGIEKDLIELLKEGIPFSLSKTENNQYKEIKFTYIGHSSSGVREGKFWAIDKDSYVNGNVAETIHGKDTYNTVFGDFKEIANIAKLSKRFSQAFTTSFETINLEEHEYIFVEDGKCGDNNEYEITDGVGVMRYETAKEISEKLKLDYIATVIQFRFRGCKGCLTALKDEEFMPILNKYKCEEPNKIKVIFRESQKKFEGNESSILNVVSYPLKVLPSASLNIEFIMILDGLGNNETREYLIDVYKNYLTDLSESINDSKKAFMKLFVNSNPSDFSVKYGSILLACGKNMPSNLEQRQHEIIKNMLIYNSLYQTIVNKKISIPIDKSKYLIGVADETETLEENEVFVSYRDSNGTMQYLNQISVIVARVPCYALSEMRTVKAKFVKKLKYLENCIVFSKKVKRPLPDMLSGGDLDGDTFLVTWDENLIGFENHEPIKYPKADDECDKVKQDRSLRDNILEYFVKRSISHSKIGIWHYYIVSLYNKSRDSMKEQEYIQSVINVNKLLDGFSVTGKSKNYKHPKWYFTSKDIKKLETGENEDEELKTKTKLKKLNEVIETKKLTIDTSKDSLLTILMSLAIEKFHDLMKPISEPIDGRFLSDDDIEFLKGQNKILKNIEDEFKDEYKDDMLKEMKKIHKVYLETINDLGEESVLGNQFAGVIEEKFNSIIKTESEKTKAYYKNEFREYVINYPYKIEIDSKLDTQILKHIHSDTGLYFQSRITQMYLNLRNTENEYLVWEFYDILCMLKNYINTKQSICISCPTTIPIQYLKAFSSTKLLNINESD